MHRLTTFFAYQPSDSDSLHFEKFAAFLIAASCCLAGVVWTLMYYLIFGLRLTALLPLSFVVIVGAALVVSHRTKNHHYAVYAQILCIMYITAFIQWSIGGIFDSGFVMVWSFLGPLTALMFFSVRQSVLWFALFFVNLLITIAFDGFFSMHGYEVSVATQRLFFGMNLGASSLVVFIFAGYFVKTAVDERERANRLLLNVLPWQIARRLKNNHGTIADRFDSVTILFADIVDSTRIFADMQPDDVVDWLNQAFSVLDDLADQHGLEKLRTIGDNYMVASGLPAPGPDHAKEMARFALEMIEALDRLPARNGKRIRFRVGINSGPAVAGVIGKSKFHYDVWGDTVNVASRMESHGQAGKIQISRATYELIRDEFDCVPHGVIDIKGKGEMETWFLVGEKEAAQRRHEGSFLL
jgi:guanylate cyclase